MRALDEQPYQSKKRFIPVYVELARELQRQACRNGRSDRSEQSPISGDEGRIAGYASWTNGGPRWGRMVSSREPLGGMVALFVCGTCQ